MAVIHIPSTNWEVVMIANQTAMGIFLIVTAYILLQHS
jgi:hypothetical protein